MVIINYGIFKLELPLKNVKLSIYLIIEIWKSKLYTHKRNKELKSINGKRNQFLSKYTPLFYIKFRNFWSHLVYFRSSPSISLPTSLLHLLLPAFRADPPRLSKRCLTSARVSCLCSSFAFDEENPTRVFSIAMVTSSYVRACIRRGNDNRNFRHRWCSKGAGRTLPAGTRESAAIQSPPYECKSMNSKKILSFIRYLFRPIFFFFKWILWWKFFFLFVIKI